jgi:TNF receptor-associated factor 4
MPDKRLQRTLNELQVYCCHKETDCEWVGELGGLPQHLNLQVNHLGDRFSGCQLVKLACKFCGNDFQRKDLLEHEGDECMQRPYSCEYCENFKATFHEVTIDHWPVCSFRPVQCPNECGISPKLQFLERHIEDECPLKMVECTFKYAGCKQTFLRKDMEDHMNQNLAIHMSLQAASHQQELIPELMTLKYS